jgi:hypothetical protein
MAALLVPVTRAREESTATLSAIAAASTVSLSTTALEVAAAAFAAPSGLISPMNPVICPLLIGLTSILEKASMPKLKSKGAKGPLA